MKLSHFGQLFALQDMKFVFLGGWVLSKIIQMVHLSWNIPDYRGVLALILNFAKVRV